MKPAQVTDYYKPISTTTYVREVIEYEKEPSKYELGASNIKGETTTKYTTKYEPEPIKYDRDQEPTKYERETTTKYASRYAREVAGREREAPKTYERVEIEAPK